MKITITGETGMLLTVDGPMAGTSRFIATVIAAFMSETLGYHIEPAAVRVYDTQAAWYDRDGKDWKFAVTKEPGV